MDRQQLEQQWQRTVQKKNMGTRLNIQHSLEFYTGYDDSCHMVLATVSTHQQKKFTNTKSIACRTFQQHGSYHYIFTLNDTAKKEIFLDVCADIINYSAQANSDYQALTALCSRYESWQEMLGRVRGNLLSEAAQRGLIGELTFLYRRIKENPDQSHDIITGWQGPERERRDFVLKDLWYEIKTVKQGVSEVKISSLAQLDTSEAGQLVVYQLEKTTADKPGAVTLNKLVSALSKIISDCGSGREIFIRKLLQYGYEENEEYDKNSFIVRDVCVYRVDDTFPALRLGTVPQAVIKAEYTLSLNGIADWLEKQQELGDLYNGI